MIKRLLCRHKWKETLISYFVSDVVASIQFTCIKCGKGKEVKPYKYNQWLVRRRLKGDVFVDIKKQREKS